MSSDLYRAMVREATELVEGRAVAGKSDLARHEAGHVVVANRLGLVVTHATLVPSPCNPRGPHVCAPADDSLLRAAVRWGGAVADRSLAWAEKDFEDLGGVGAHLPGKAFDLAERIIAANGEAVTRIADALRADSEEILFAEDIEGLIGAPAVRQSEP